MGIFSPGIPTEGDELEGFLRHNVANEIWENYSGNRILNDLRAAGARIGDQSFFQIRGEILGFQRYFSSLARLGGDTTVPRSNYVYEHGWQLSQKFLYNFDVHVLHTRTGETEFINRSWSSDREQTVGELMGSLGEAIEAKDGETDMIVLGSSMRFALAREDAFI